MSSTTAIANKQLWSALRAGNIDAALKAVSDGANIHVKSGGKSPFMFASENLSLHPLVYEIAAKYDYMLPNYLKELAIKAGVSPSNQYVDLFVNILNRGMGATQELLRNVIEGGNETLIKEVMNRGADSRCMVNMTPNVLGTFPPILSWKKNEEPPVWLIERCLDAEKSDAGFEKSLVLRVSTLKKSMPAFLKCMCDRPHWLMRNGNGSHLLGWLLRNGKQEDALKVLNALDGFSPSAREQGWVLSNFIEHSGPLDEELRSLLDQRGWSFNYVYIGEEKKISLKHKLFSYSLASGSLEATEKNLKQDLKTLEWLVRREKESEEDCSHLSGKESESCCHYLVLNKYRNNPELATLGLKLTLETYGVNPDGKCLVTSIVELATSMVQAGQQLDLLPLGAIADAAAFPSWVSRSKDNISNENKEVGAFSNLAMRLVSEFGSNPYCLTKDGKVALECLHNEEMRARIAAFHEEREMQKNTSYPEQKNKKTLRL